MALLASSLSTSSLDSARLRGEPSAERAHAAERRASEAALRLAEFEASALRQELRAAKGRCEDLASQLARERSATQALGRERDEALAALRSQARLRAEKAALAEALARLEAKHGEASQRLRASEQRLQLLETAGTEQEERLREAELELAREARVAAAMLLERDEALHVLRSERGAEAADRATMSRLVAERDEALRQLAAQEGRVSELLAAGGEHAREMERERAREARVAAAMLLERDARILELEQALDQLRPASFRSCSSSPREGPESLASEADVEQDAPASPLPKLPQTQKSLPDAQWRPCRPIVLSLTTTSSLAAC